MFMFTSNQFANDCINFCFDAGPDVEEWLRTEKAKYARTRSGPGLNQVPNWAEFVSATIKILQESALLEDTKGNDCFTEKYDGVIARLETERDRYRAFFARQRGDAGEPTQTAAPSDHGSVEHSDADERLEDSGGPTPGQ